MKLFRYKKTDLFFLFTFWISFSCLWFVAFYSGKEKQYKKDASAYSYQSSAMLLVQNAEGELDIGSIIGKTDELVYVSRYPLFFDDAEAVVLSNIVLCGERNAVLPCVGSKNTGLSEGMLLGWKQKGVIPVVRDSVVIDDSSVPWAGLLGCTYSGYCGYDIYIPFRFLNNNTGERMKHTSSVSVVVRSNGRDASVIASELKTELEKASSGCTILVGQYADDVADTDNHDEKVLLMLMFVFSAFACIIVSDLWMRVRKIELSTLLIFGYTWKRLCLHFCLEGIKLGICAWVAGFLPFAVMRIIKQDVSVLVFLKDVRWLSFLLYALLMVCICVLIQSIKALRNPSVAQVIKAGGE